MLYVAFVISFFLSCLLLVLHLYPCLLHIRSSLSIYVKLGMSPITVEDAKHIPTGMADLSRQCSRHLAAS